MRMLSKLLPDGAFEMFPLLEVLHVHVGPLNRKDKKLEQSACTVDSLALADLVSARKDGGAPIREIVVEQALAGWDVWDAIRSDVLVTLFDF